jgi:hypothetical protein
MAVATTAARERAPSARESVRRVRARVRLASLAAALMLVIPAEKLAVGAQVPEPPVVSAADPAVTDLLAKAASYLDRYEKGFSAVVAEETYFQTSTGRTSRRELKSDVMVVNLGDAHWVQLRDVFQVDGKKVRDHDARLENLFLKPTSSTLAEASRIAGESARYNLGISRTINVPTMALTYLVKAYQLRSRFESPKPDTIDGRAVSVMPFQEVFFPTLIRDRARFDVPTSGRFWIDSSTGEVLRTELRCAIASKDRTVTGVTTVSYKMHPEQKMMVPATMDEEWTQGRDKDRGHATYANFRTFNVDVQTVKRGRG